MRTALASKRAGGVRCRLTPAQLRELETALDAGPATWGWDEDQCWTLARIAPTHWCAITANIAATMLKMSARLDSPDA